VRCVLAAVESTRGTRWTKAELCRTAKASRIPSGRIEPQRHGARQLARWASKSLSLEDYGLLWYRLRQVRCAGGPWGPRGPRSGLRRLITFSVRGPCGPRGVMRGECEAYSVPSISRNDSPRRSTGSPRSILRSSGSLMSHSAS
jgi:hypothetical protein